VTPLDPLALPLRGVNLIEASAGTGKTFTITTLFLRLLLEEERRLGEILVVTYTNAATAELRTRLRQRLATAHAAWGTAARGERSASGEGAGERDEALDALLERRAAAGLLERDRHRLTQALYGFDEASVFTIHGFCQRVLQENAFESGMPFDVQLVTDQRSLVREIVRDFWVRELHGAPSDFVAFAQARHEVMRELAGLAAKAVSLRDAPVLPARADLPESADPAQRFLRLKVELAAHVREELRLRKEKAGILYFDDLLTRLRDALAAEGGERLARALRQRWRAALIDEFQDTDPVQYDIFRRVYGAPAPSESDAPLFLIGDPKQAIYSFRGADVHTYIAAKRHAGEGRARTLGVNYRSDERLVVAVNALFGRAGVRAPFLLEGIDYQGVAPRPDARERLGGALAQGAPLQILHLPNPGKAVLNKKEVLPRLFRQVPHEIARLLAAGGTIDGEPLRASHVAVLCRRNAEARQLQLELRALRIPSVLQTDESVLETNEAEELARVVRALAEPGDGAALLAALATPMLGVHAVELQALRDGGEAWDLWTARFHRGHEIWREAGFMPAFRALLHECEVEKRVLGGVDGERRMTNFLHLGEILQTHAVESRRGPLALSEWFDQMRADEGARSDAVADAAQIRLESDDLALELVTVHRSKGLEYPIVYCPFLWEGQLLHRSEKDELRFHDPERDGALALDIGSPDLPAHRKLAEREALAENLRLLYVALTRARHRCVVVWGRLKFCETSALGYLLHQPPEADAEVTPASVAARIETLDDRALRADLQRLVEASAGAVGIAELSSADGPVYAQRDAHDADPVWQPPGRVPRLGWRTASFSSLTAGGEHVSAPAEEGLDRDDTDVGEPLAALADGAGEAERAGAPQPAPAPIPLADFPTGTRAGHLVHSILERCDFRAPAAELRAEVDRALAAYGFEPRWSEALTRAVAAVLATPLQAGADTFRLAEVARERRLSELEFLFSLRGGGLDSGRLAAPFARHAPALRPEYVERLRHLGFAPVSGFLKGFVDLVFEHRGRWYVLDWKSNHLGAERRFYDPGRLRAAMEQHHYYLQYHLYVVALHRYLGLRLADYDYERHFGGVFYLFVRGMDPSAAAAGVFFDRPARALVEALEVLL